MRQLGFLVRRGGAEALGLHSMNAVVTPTGLILATWARQDEDALAAPCAYKRILRRAPGKGFGRFGGRRLLGKLNEHPIGALTVRLPRKGKPTVEL
jgi:hypothetical protein